MNFSFSSKRFWSRLGHHNAIGLPLLCLALVFTALLSFAFDAVRLGNYTWLWVPANVLAIIVAAAPLLPVLALKRRQNKAAKKQPWFNIIFSSVFFGIKNLAMFYITPLFGIPEDGNPAYRFLGGIVIGFAILALYTNFVGNRREREETLIGLLETEAALLDFRDAAFEQLEEENRTAALRAYKVLYPMLLSLQNNARDMKEVFSFAGKLVDFIGSELRPFSKNLSLEAAKLAQKSKANHSVQRSDPRITVNISKSIQVWNSLIPVPIISYLLADFVVPAATALDILLASLLFASTLATLKIMTIPLQPVPITTAFVASTCIAFFSAIPSYLLISQLVTSDGVPELLAAFLVVPGWALIAAALAHILDLKQAKIEEELKTAVTQLNRENKLYEQKAWLAGHGWYLLLHGVVQPALTSALIRVNSTTSVTPEVRLQAVADLQRALNALQQEPNDVQPPESNFDEIKSVWMGICDINFRLSNEIIEVLIANNVTSNVVNEILKEVVSNAVRHGNAKNITADFSLLGTDNLHVIVTNDGLEPTQEKLDSVGSQMLDAVCLQRTLIWDQATGRTKFEAVVPF